MTTTHFVNFYEILQVSASAQPDEIKAAITKQRRLWVKRQTSSDPARRTEAEARVRDIDQAERTLLDPGSRAAFDRALAGHRESGRPVGGSADGIGWLERARTYLSEDNANAANYAAREAINQRGNDDEAWFIRGHSSFLLGNGRDAEYELAEAIRLRSDHGLYHYTLGEVFAAQEKWQPALSQYEQALKLEPGNPEYRTSIAVVLLQTDHSTKALEIMEGVVRDHPNNQAFLFYLAIALHDSGLESLGKAGPLFFNGQLINEGGFMIVSEAQADLMDKRADRITGLHVRDPEVGKMVTEIREMVREARTMRWNLTNSLPWLLGFLFLGVAPLFGGAGSGSGGAAVFGLFAGALIVFLYVTLRRKPAWKHLRQELIAQNRLESAGI